VSQGNLFGDPPAPPPSRPAPAEPAAPIHLGHGPVVRLPIISLWQPWAWLLVRMYKDVENRRWPLPSSYAERPVLIHAAKRRDDPSWLSANAMYQDIHRAPPEPLPSWEHLELGGIVGIVRFQHVTLRPKEEPSAAWHMPNQFGWVVDRAAPLPFTPLRGQQGFWSVDVTMEEGFLRGFQTAINHVPTLRRGRARGAP
jgi:hypothetical protein